MTTTTPPNETWYTCLQCNRTYLLQEFLPTKPQPTIDGEMKKEFYENVNYDDAELGCNWSQDDLWDWITTTYRSRVMGEVVSRLQQEYEDKISNLRYIYEDKISTLRNIHGAELQALKLKVKNQK